MCKCGYVHVSARSHRGKKVLPPPATLELELQRTVSNSNPQQEKYTPLTPEPAPRHMNYTMLLIVTETTDETFTYDKHAHQMKNLPNNYGNAMFKVYIVKPS